MIRSSRSGAPSIFLICTRLSQREAKHDSGVLICKKNPTMNAVRTDGALKIGAHPVGAVFFFLRCLAVEDAHSSQFAPR